MDKYNKKTAFQKWFSAINVNECSREAQTTIKKFDYYHKKLDFETTIKILLHAIYEKLSNYREIGRAFMDKRLCQEVSINSLSHSSLSRRGTEIDTNILMEIVTNLVQKVSNKRPSSKTSSLQLIDSTTIPLNKTWFPWAKFRQTKSGIKLHLNLCYLDKNNQYPESFMITNYKEQDRSQFELLVNKTEATYVVDPGYFDYKLLDRLHNDGYFFVTRTKSNTRITA